jgi:hypothetical protein
MQSRHQYHTASSWLLLGPRFQCLQMEAAVNDGVEDAVHHSRRIGEDEYLCEHFLSIT